VDTAGTTSPAIAAVRYLPTATLHDLTVGHTGHGSARTPDTPPWTPDGGHPDAQTPTPDTGQRSRDRRTWTLDAPDTGHRTQAEDVDTMTKARPASSTSWAATPTAAPWDAQPCSSGQRSRRLATVTAQRVGHLRVRLPLALPRSCSAAPAKSRLGALLSSDDVGSSVGRRSGGHPVYGGGEQRSGASQYSVVAGRVACAVARCVTAIRRTATCLKTGQAALWVRVNGRGRGCYQRGGGCSSREPC
jgi:hypothetical protein